MMTVFNVRFTSSAPKVMDFGNRLAKNSAMRFDRVIRIGASELITMQRIPANGVRYVPA